MLAKLGYFSESELEKYCKPEGILRMHADYSIPGCFFIGGSLGNGIGFATGLAIARPWQNFIVLLGDAELYEGSIWETLLFINHHKLNNLTLIVDRNKFGILGDTEDTIKLNSISEKMKAFGFKVSEIDGHDLTQLREVLRLKPLEPHVIIANTIKGKGVSYMEDKYEYHTIIPSSTQDITQGLMELK
jgi:transketolase